MIKFNYIATLILLILSIAVFSHSQNRIISLSPNTTEILYALGMDDKIVGVTKFCNYPPEAKSKPIVGGYTDLNFEKVLTLSPTLVIILPFHDNIKNKLDALDINTLTVKNETIDNILDAITLIGKATGAVRKAAHLRTQLSNELMMYKEKTKNQPSKRVLFVIGRNFGTLGDIYTVGKHSFINELIRMAGGQNIFQDVNIRYPQVSQEEILARNPEIIIETLPKKNVTQKDKLKHKNAWHQLPGLYALKNDNIYLLEQNHILIPGPRIVKSLKLLYGIIHTH